MTNRLALNHILTTQLRRDWEQEESAKTRLSQLTRRDRIKASLRSSQLPGRYLLPDTRKTYDNMVANIHSTMKSVRSPRKPRPTVPLPTSGNPSAAPAVAPPLPTNLVSKHPKRSKSGRIRGGANSSKADSGHGIAANTNHKSLATIKANINQSTKRSRGFEQNSRIREVIQQKKVLETMLQQHKKLQSDRHTIAMDIQRMRADLDRIRTKLDTSLQSLNSTRTLFNSANKASLRKANVLPKQNTHNVVTSTHRRSGGKRKVRTVAIPMNRQSVLANKAPILKRRVR
ncbi:uncharacterized protein LOC6526908 [Drosophila yakuba]|uniref:Uncharacterized protein n=1 Tax=Drosophila yakuba TaxID=7245 RepID=B4NZH0_DROYA|nr:uncharacterized protein LOC6526908 [Drosophila yakuba]EDW87719.1 uncharacterized protein Dyak_GE14618 [Drosophila yakuba]